MLFQGWGKNLADSISELGVLPLADRKLTIGSQVSGMIPLLLLAVALLLVGFGVLDIEVAFFARRC